MLTRPHTNPRRVPLRKVEGCGACVKTAQIKFLVTVSKAAHNVGNKYSILWGICKFDEVMISVHYKVVCVTNSVLDDSGPNFLQTVNELLLCSSGLIHHHHDHLHPMRQDLAGRFMVIFDIYSLDSSPASKSCFFAHGLHLTMSYMSCCTVGSCCTKSFPWSNVVIKRGKGWITNQENGGRAQSCLDPSGLWFTACQADFLVA